MGRTRLKYWGPGGILLGFLAVVPVVAQEPSEQEEPAEHAEVEHHHRNEVVLLLGMTHEAEGSKNFFTIGGEYGRMLTPRIAVTAAVEHISEIDAWVFVFPVGFSIYKGWFVTAGPGFEGSSRRSRLIEDLEEELEEGHHLDEDEVHVALTTGRDRFFLLRFGTGYKYELGSRYAVMAELAFDFVFEEHETARAFVIGAKFAVGF